MTENPLVRLGEQGQSVWYDNVRRGLIANGDLGTMIAAGEITGVTSNPTIFEKAIGGSTDYDAAFGPLVEAGKDAGAIFEALAVDDIRAVADLLRPVYERTAGRDGYVSLEVAPRLAHDTRQTLAEARRLFALLGRENVMIKIPGTPEGIAAFEQATADGINVNVTLLFALESYERVARAYVAGLERRASANQPIDRIASVASFFVSRVDTATDPALEERARGGAADLADLAGTVAVANARLAYQRFKAIFAEPRFQALAERGAMVQRPLWASTGTKNPRYSDVLYVEELIGPDTVNTMPPATLDAFRDHGRVAPTIEKDVAGAEATIRRLAGAGLDLAAITLKLQADGVASFEESFDKLIEAVGRKRAALQQERVGQSATNVAPEAARGPAGLAGRIWAKDGAAWSDDPAARKMIPTALGWLSIADLMSERLDEILALANEVREAKFGDVFLLGMGGSSLCPEVLRQTFGSAPGSPRLTVLDTTHPDMIRAAAEGVDLAGTLFLVASKSGGTLESTSLFRHFYAMVKALKGERAGDNFVALTDPGTSLEKLAHEHRFRRVIATPPDVGGRYSALTPFGLVPAALIGMDVRGLLDRAHTMMHACASCVPADENPGLWLGLRLGNLALQGRDKVTLIVPPAIASFGLWAEQLIAESTGKEGKGLVPVAGEPLGGPEAYGDDRVFVYVRVGSAPAPALDDGVARLEAAGRPVVRLELRDTLDLGGEFFRWEFATAVTGAILRVNAFDQPNVQESKDKTSAVLADWQKSGDLPAADAATDEEVAAFLGQADAGEYVAIMAYLPISAENDARLGAIRTAIRDRWRVATTVGYGPRFLHSTGQIHKGGPDSGRYIQIVAEPEGDLEIPSQPYTFGTLIRAQALGDLRSLEAHGRRAIRVDLGRDVAGGLARLERVIGAIPVRAAAR